MCAEIAVCPAWYVPRAAFSAAVGALSVDALLACRAALELTGFLVANAECRPLIAPSLAMASAPLIVTALLIVAIDGAVSIVVPLVVAIVLTAFPTPLAVNVFAVDISILVRVETVMTVPFETRDILFFFVFGAARATS